MQLRQKQHGEVAQFVVETITAAGDDGERGRTESGCVAECEFGIARVFVARKPQHLGAERLDGS